jgi:predicted anti-sigma-YlaC factor YlaD
VCVGVGVLVGVAVIDGVGVDVGQLIDVVVHAVEFASPPTESSARTRQVIGSPFIGVGAL